jgi:RNA polymerase sigma factor (sigma-70 family)
VLSRLYKEREQFLAFIRARVRDEAAAQDILQSAYLKLFTHSRNLRRPERADAWFYRVLRNLVADTYRGTAQNQSDGEAMLEDLPAASTETLNICPCMTREIDHLRPDYAQALRAVELEEQTVKNYARSAGISEGNAFVRLHRARRALRKRLEAVCRACAGVGCLDCSCG